MFCDRELVMYQSIISWLKDYFSANAVLPDDVENINYFEAGLINSMGIIELIEAIESQFEIKFNAMHFQERRFSTVRGLAEIIDKLKKEL